MSIVFVIIGVSFLIFGHELGHFLSAKLFGVRVDEFGFGFPPRIFGKRMGETLYSINALPFGGFVRIYGEGGASTEEGDTARSFIRQPVWKRGIIMLAGVFMNFVIGWLFMSFVFMMGIPSHLGVLEAAPNSPAAEAGIKAGDLIVEASYGGNTFSDPVRTEKFIALVHEAGTDEIDLTLNRAGERVSVALRGRANPPEGEGSLGVGIADTGVPATPFLGSLVKGGEEVAGMTKMIAVGFVSLLGQAFTTPSVLREVAGPVGVVSIASKASELGFVYFLQFLALLSANLVVVNLLPFPALDGGKFLFLVYEKIRGKPASERVQIAVNIAGFALLILLMIVVTIQDVTRLFH